MINAINRCEAIVIGASAGGWTALKTILGGLPGDFPLAIMVVMHRHPHSDGYLEKSLDYDCALRVKQADEKEAIVIGTVYFAPPNYHLLIEDTHTLSLSVNRAVNYARPSIDVLFKSAAHVYGDTLAGLVLTGANSDGAGGLKKIKEMGGLTLVQDPGTAEASAMPHAAIAVADPDVILPLDEIGAFLKDFVRSRKRYTEGLKFEN